MDFFVAISRKFNPVRRRVFLSGAVARPFPFEISMPQRPM
jgi:hypothetical protein